MYDLQNLVFEPIYADHLIAYIDETTKEKGARIVLAKDSTADVAMLDKTVGPANWKDSIDWDFSRGQGTGVTGGGKEKPFMVATLSIKDPESKEWISKIGVGEATEYSGFSDKALETDAIKRAGFKWGIGRELKRTPKAYIPFDDLGTSEKTKPTPIYTNSKNQTIMTNEYDEELYKASDVLEVLAVDYEGEGYEKKVCWMRIRNKLTDKTYSFGKPVNEQTKEVEVPTEETAKATTTKEPEKKAEKPKKTFKATKSKKEATPDKVDTSVIIDFGCFEKNPTPLNKLAPPQIVWVRTSPLATDNVKAACDVLARNSEELQRQYSLKKLSI